MYRVNLCQICFYLTEIRLKFEGFGNVHWTERHSSGSGKHRHTTTRHYSARESYFDIKVALYGQSKNIYY
jgi:hypothetical protein